MRINDRLRPCLTPQKSDITIVPRYLAKFLLLSLVLLLIACDSSPKIYQLSGSIMGTTYHVSVVSNEPLSSELASGVHSQLVGIDQLMSTYKKNSEINRVNRLAVGQILPVSAEMVEILAVSREVFDYTGGAFEPTIGPLVDLWGFGPDKKTQVVPNAVDVDELRAKIGLLKLSVNGDKLTKLADIQLDLSAVAKGYGVDVVSDYLRQQGYFHHLVEVGGEMRLTGRKPDGQKWHIGIEAPQLYQGHTQLILSVSDVAVATSGDYRNYFEQDGKRYSHTIDPRTGYPITHAMASITVIADNAALADALATGFSVLGDEQSLQIAEELGLPIYLLVQKGDGFEARYSSAFKPYLP
jgi:thiamine biosynthesis lipoprotein